MANTFKYLGKTSAKYLVSKLVKPATVTVTSLSVSSDKATKAEAISNKYYSELIDLKDAFIAANLANDTETIADIQKEYNDLMASYSAELEAIK